MTARVRAKDISSESNNSKNKTPVSESSTCFGCETKTGVLRNLVIFQDRAILSHLCCFVYNYPTLIKAPSYAPSLTTFMS